MLKKNSVKEVSTVEEDENVSPSYQCDLCGKKSDPEAKSEKRSISMHVANKHKIESGNPSDFYSKIGTSESENKQSVNGRKKQSKGERVSQRKQPRNVRRRPEKDGKYVFIVQAKYETKYEAAGARGELLDYYPELDDFVYQRENYMFVRCSSRGKAEGAESKVRETTDPVRTSIETEFVEEGKSFLQKIKSFVPFVGSESKTSTPSQRETSEPRPRPKSKPRPNPEHEPRRESESQKTPQTGQIPRQKTRTRDSSQTPPTSKKEDTGNGKQVAGYTISADQYKHFIETEADPSDMESLMMMRQQIAKGEGMGGMDPRKWAGAIAIVLIILAVVYIMISGGSGGGGGGVGIPGVGSIP